MSTPTTPHPDDPALAAATDQPVTAPHTAAASNPDPLTGEPGAHPVGVGVGALSAGVAGAAIGSIGGPIGVLIGAAIGAVAGGLAGKEVAATGEPPVESDAEPVITSSEPPLVLPDDTPTPITMGSVPGEGFRAVMSSGFMDDPSLPPTDTPTETSTLPAAPTVAQEDDALPMVAATGLQESSMDEEAPLMGGTMPASGEEAVRVAAYYQFLERMRSGHSGDEVGDWLQAEREMMLN